MKILSLVLVALFMFGGLAMADVLSDPPEGATGETTWQTTGGAGVNNWLNNNARHEHAIPARENALGLGLDVDYVFTDTYSAAVEYRYDFQNEEHATYLVGKVRLGKK